MGVGLSKVLLMFCDKGKMLVYYGLLNEAALRYNRAMLMKTTEFEVITI
jgi:hypothetical protein